MLLARAAACLASFPLCGPPAPAAAQEGADDGHVARRGDIEIVHAWARATDGADGTVFMEVHNEGDGPDRLVGGSAGIAERVEVHGALMRDGRMVSEPLGAMPISADTMFELEPNAVFLKLVGLRRPLVEGEAFDMEVAFERTGAIPVEVQVEAAGARQHGHAGHAHRPAQPTSAKGMSPP